jgi:ketosteroid isomerase-like protein
MNAESRQSAIDALLSLYAAIDAGDVDDAVAAFTEDAVYEASIGRPEGSAEIRRFFEAAAARAGRRIHVLANARATSAEDGKAEVSALVMLYEMGSDDQGAPRLLRAVPSLFTLRRRAGRWLIEHRSSGSPGAGRP